MTYNVFGGTLSLTQSINQSTINEQMSVPQINRTFPPNAIFRHILTDSSVVCDCLSVSVTVFVCLSLNYLFSVLL